MLLALGLTNKGRLVPMPGDRHLHVTLCESPQTTTGTRYVNPLPAYRRRPGRKACKGRNMKMFMGSAKVTEPKAMILRQLFALLALDLRDSRQAQQSGGTRCAQKTL